MRKKNFEKGFFDEDFFAEFERIEEIMRDMLDAHFQEFEKGDTLEPNTEFRPRVYGFTLDFGPEGKAKFAELAGKPSVQKSAPIAKAHDPFVEVINGKDEITLVTEIPGVEQKHLHLKPYLKQIAMRVTDPDRMLSKTIALPFEVDPASMHYSLKNGILEIIFKKK